MKFTVKILSMLCVLGMPVLAGAQDTHNSDQDEDAYTLKQLDELRQIHEGTIFILKHYATLDALLTAMDRKKDANTAFWIGAASMIPGAGQILNEDYLKGGLFFFASSVSWSTVKELEFTRKKQPANQNLLPWYYTSLFLRNGIMTYAMLHAASNNYQEKHDHTAAMWTGAASMIPGTGQAINKDWLAAAGFLVSWSGLSALTAYLEKSVFMDGDDGYLVKRNDKDYDLDFSYLPGGVEARVTLSW